MTKVLHRNGKSYDQVAPTSLYEIDVEQNILIHGETLYPEHFILPCKILVETDQGETAKPDLAFIAKDYREWWIVEVEMEEHSLESHVLPQMEILSNGAYSDQHAKYFCEKLPELDYLKISNLIQSIPPRLMVIVNTQPSEIWYKELEQLGVSVSVFEVFRASDEDEVFRLDGEHIAKFVDTVTQCFCDGISPNLLRIDTPERLDVPPRGIVKIRYNDYVTEWQRVDAQSKVWLIPLKRNPLPMREKFKYELLRHRDGSLTIRITK